MSYQRIKSRTYEILEKGNETDVWSRRADGFIILLIILNIIAVILESVSWMAEDYDVIFLNVERFSIAFFTIEYLLRIWSITEEEEFSHPFMGRLRYLFSFYSLIDLAAVIPAYVPLLMTVDARVIRGIRILRLFRILKLTRYNRAMSQIRLVLSAAKEELIISLAAVLGLLVFASCLMYFIEHDEQPEAFSSIPATMWWGVATLTTVGYGDVYPITGLGKLVGGVMAILGVGLFALPAGILANGFGRAIELSREAKAEDKDSQDQVESCHHCGRKMHK